MSGSNVKVKRLMEIAVDILREHTWMVGYELVDEIKVEWNYSGEGKLTTQALQSAFRKLGGDGVARGDWVDGHVRWSLIKGEDVVEDKPEVKRTDDVEEHIYKYIADKHPTKVSVLEISDEVGYGRPYVKKRLDNLLLRGTIMTEVNRSGIGRPSLLYGVSP